MADEHGGAGPEGRVADVPGRDVADFVGFPLGNFPGLGVLLLGLLAGLLPAVNDRPGLRWSGRRRR